MAARGLKTKIAFNVALLLLIATFLTDVLVVIIMQSVLIRNSVKQYRKTIERSGYLIFTDQNIGNFSKVYKDKLINAILPRDDFPSLVILKSPGSVIHQHENSKYPLQLMQKQIALVEITKQTEIKEHRLQWQMLWWRPQFVSITIPIILNGKSKGIISAVIPLTELYQISTQYHKPVVFYLMLNAVILTLVGLYRIFRIYLRPIDRIVQQADGFHEDTDLLFTFRQEDNELNRLSSALNRMIAKISSDKEKLKENIKSLELANLEIKNAHKEIIRAEKMASIGRLAAGIAHEIGNPIGIVLGYLDLLKKIEIDESEKLDFLNRCESEIQRINLIIRQLLDLTRPKEAENQLFSCHYCIQNIVTVMKMQPILSNVQIRLELNAQRDKIWGNEERLRQVLLNLFLNAADAIMESKNCDNGLITVRTDTEGETDGNDPLALNIEFSDNGIGINPEKIQSIFDPFFTTKEPGKGTGLGLAVSYMIIEGMNGQINATSQIGQGTTFLLHFPLSQDRPALEANF